jgi:hypothetical protein
MINPRFGTVLSSGAGREGMEQNALYRKHQFYPLYVYFI